MTLWPWVHDKLHIAFTRKGQNPIGILELRQVKGVRIAIFHSG